METLKQYVYKNLENKETAVNEVSDREASLKIIDKAINNYIGKFWSAFFQRWTKTFQLF